MSATDPAFDPEAHGVVKVASGMLEAMIGRHPARYFRPPYLGGKGWIGCWLEPETEPAWDELADLIDESYRLIAPKWLVAVLDADGPTGMDGQEAGGLA